MSKLPRDLARCYPNPDCPDDADAIEIFPADMDVVNVANMRHLWVMAEPVEFAWRKK